EPTPPSTHPANINSSSWKPICHVTSCDRPWRIPPNAASPAPAAHTQLMTRSTSMPDASARSRLSYPPRLLGELPVAAREARELEQEDVTPQEPHADADHHHGDEARAPVAQRPPEAAVDQRPREGGYRDGGGGGPQHRPTAWTV